MKTLRNVGVAVVIAATLGIPALAAAPQASAGDGSVGFHGWYYGYCLGWAAYNGDWCGIYS